MQELRVHNWCDQCHDEHATFVPATNKFLMAIDVIGAKNRKKMQPRILDLCDAHVEPVQHLREFLLRAGCLPDLRRESDEPANEPVEQPAEQPTEQPPLLDLSRRDGGRHEKTPCPACNETVMRRYIPEHLARQHGIRKPKAPTRCPECNGRFAGTTQAVGTHRFRAHGYSLVDDMIRMVKEATMR